MPRPHRGFCLLFLLLTTTTAFVRAQVPKDFHPNLAILQSPKATGKITQARVIEALWYAAADLNIPIEKIPRILVLHADLDAAHVVLMRTLIWDDARKLGGAVVGENTEDGGKLYYLWLIGRPSDDVLARGMVKILQPQAGLTDDQVASVAHRVLIRMRTLVRSDELHNG